MDLLTKTISLYKEMGISEEVYAFGTKILESLKERFDDIDKMAEYNQLKVVNAMQKARVGAECFNYASGYGYNDYGRDTLEQVYANVFHTEDALVRPQITCGTHALALTLSANLRPGDELISIAGKPYDTLEEVIGIRKSMGSLAEYGVTYQQVDLLPDGSFDFASIEKAISEKTKMVTIQRSKGYQTRPSFSVDQIGEAIAFVKKVKPDVIVMVDNCYGEFVETREPTEVGADIIAGSLIKNIGGSLCEIGGYIAGKKELVELAAERLTAPGIGKECGATLGKNKEILQGLYMAPTIVKNAIMSVTYAARLMQEFGIKADPAYDEERTDIVEQIEFNDKDKLIKFIQGLQAQSPIDSFVTPMPWDMPGYSDQVIMAAGTFVSGASIELSADAPIKEPYIAYLQGGITYESAKLSILSATVKMLGDDKHE